MLTLSGALPVFFFTCSNTVKDASACAKIVCEEMEAAMELRVPLRADAGIGPDWMSAK